MKGSVMMQEKTTRLAGALFAGLMTWGQAGAAPEVLAPYIDDTQYKSDELDPCDAINAVGTRAIETANVERALCLYNARLSKERLELEQGGIESRNSVYNQGLEELDAATWRLSETFDEIDIELLTGSAPKSRFMTDLRATYGELLYRIAWDKTGAAFHDRSRHGPDPSNPKNDGTRKRGGKENLADMSRHKRWVSEAMSQPKIAAATSNLGGKGLTRDEALEAQGLQPAAPKATNSAWKAIMEQARKRNVAADGFAPSDRAPKITPTDIAGRMATGTDGFNGPNDNLDPEEEANKASLEVMRYVARSQRLTLKTKCAFHGVEVANECRRVWNSSSCVYTECAWEQPYAGETIMSWLATFKTERAIACYASEGGQNEAAATAQGKGRPDWLRPRCNQAVHKLREQRGEETGKKPHWRIDHRGDQRAGTSLRSDHQRDPDPGTAQRSDQ